MPTAQTRGMQSLSAIFNLSVSFKGLDDCVGSDSSDCIWAVLASQDRGRSMDLGEIRHMSLFWALDSIAASRKSASYATDRWARLG